MPAGSCSRRGGLAAAAAAAAARTPGGGAELFPAPRAAGTRAAAVPVGRTWLSARPGGSAEGREAAGARGFGLRPFAPRRLGREGRPAAQGAG